MNKWLGAGMLLLSSGIARAQSGIDYNLYYRTGLNYSRSNVDGVCYNSPGWPDLVPRLGNECGNYLEMMLSKTYKPKGDDPKATWYKGTLTFSMVADGNQSDEQVRPKTKADGTASNDNDFAWGNREIYVESGNLVSEGSKFWVGKRFYRRLAIPMWDFFFLQHNGLGFGLEDQSLGGGKVSAAWLRHANGSQENEPLHNALDLRYAIPLGTSSLEFIAIAGEQGPLARDSGINSWEKITGQSMTVYWENKERPYQYKVAAQYGHGLYGARPDGYKGGWSSGSTLSRFEEYAFSAADPLDKEKADAWQKSSSYRAVANLLWTPDAAYWVDMAAFYGSSDFGGRKDPTGATMDPRTTAALGLRPAYNFTEHHSAEADLYYSVITNGEAYSGAGFASKYDGKPIDRYLSKVTLAYVLRPLAFEWAKPVFRFYGTLARWNDRLKGDNAINGYERTVYQDKTSGYTLGVMAEVWL